MLSELQFLFLGAAQTRFPLSFSEAEVLIQLSLQSGVLQLAYVEKLLVQLQRTCQMVGVADRLLRKPLVQHIRRGRNVWLSNAKMLVFASVLCRRPHEFCGDIFISHST